MKITASGDNHLFTSKYVLLAISWILLIIILQTIAVWNIVDEAENSFEHVAESIYIDILQKLRINDVALIGLSAHIDTFSGLRREEAGVYAKNMVEQYPHIYLFEVAQHVKGDKLKAFAEHLSSSGYKDTRIQTFSYKERKWRKVNSDNYAHYPIILVEPFSENLSNIIGLDIYNINFIKDAIDASYVSGKPVSTIPFELIEGGLAYILLKAIKYPESVIGEADSNPAYVTILIVRLKDLVPIHLLSENTDIQLSRIGGNGKNEVIYGRHKNTQLSLLPILESTRSFYIEGQPYSMSIRKYSYWSDLHLNLLASTFILSIASIFILLYYVKSRFQEEKSDQLNELAIQESENKYRTIVEGQTDLICRWRKDGIINFVNDAYCKYFDAPEKDLVGKETASFFSSNKITEIVNSIESDQSTESSYSHEYKYITRVGALRWLFWSHKANYKNQVLVDYLSVGNDITDKKLAEAALKNSEKKYRELIDHLQEGIWVFDKDAYITFTNPYMSEILGYSEAEMLGKHFYSFMSKEEIELAKNSIEKQKRGFAERKEFLLTKKDGEKIYVGMDTGPITDSEGCFSGTIACVIDITDKKIPENKLRMERNRAQQYLDIAGVMLISLDCDGQVNLINKKGCDVLECKEQDILGKNWFDNFVPHDKRDEIMDQYKAMLTSSENVYVHYKYEVMTLKGRVINIEWKSSLIQDEDNNIIGILSSGEEVTA